jgi:hypothetical protein
MVASGRENSLPIGSNAQNAADVPFPNPSMPEQDPFGSVTNPPHISIEVWQASYYDPTSQNAASVFVKRPSGPVSLENGRLTGEGFHAGHKWKQV